MSAQRLDINDEFGVGGEFDDPGAAFLSERLRPEAPTVPQFLPSSARAQHQNPYDPRLIVDLARNIDPVSDILARYGLSQEELDRLFTHPAFRRDLAETTRDLHETGERFRLNARAIAEQGLETLDGLMHDPETPASVVLSIMQTLARWARLEPGKDDDKGSAPTVNIQINVPQYQ